jgi:hypothetical protein
VKHSVRVNDPSEEFVCILEGGEFDECVVFKSFVNKFLFIY